MIGPWSMMIDFYHQRLHQKHQKRKYLKKKAGKEKNGVNKKDRAMSYVCLPSGIEFE
jgi:hypothetical protein